jgi:hypothetical protein
MHVPLGIFPFYDFHTEARTDLEEVRISTEHAANIVPNQEVLVQPDRAVAAVKAKSSRVL